MEEFIIKFGIRIKYLQSKNPLLFTQHKADEIAKMLNYSVYNYYTSLAKAKISIKEEKKFEFINYIYNLKDYDLDKILADLMISEMTLRRRLESFFGIKNLTEFKKMIKENNDEI